MKRFSTCVSGKVLLENRPPRPEAPEHVIGSIDCSCGFYAYFDLEDNPHHHRGNVLGIIEGFGITTVGSRGFRCAKAQIRALIIQPYRGYPQDGRLGRMVKKYNHLPRYARIEDAVAEFPLSPPPERA